MSIAVAVLSGAFSASPATAQEPLGATGNVVVARDPDGLGNSSDLFLHEPGTAAEVNLTNGTATQSFRSPVWSPDGTKIAYVLSTKNSDGEWVGDVWVMNADGSGKTARTNNLLADDRDPAWSPDSSKIVFASDRTGKYELYRVNATGTMTLAQLTPYAGMDLTKESLDPTWASDGSAIAFEHRTDVVDGPGVETENDSQIYRLTLDGNGAPSGFGAMAALANTNNVDPAYSPDATLLAFSSDRGYLADPANPGPRGDYSIYTTTADPGVVQDPEDVTPGGADDAAYPQWLPRATAGGARQLVYARDLDVDDSDLFTVDVATKAQAGLLVSDAHDLEASYQTLPACDVAWDGGADGEAGNWHDVSNWDRNSLPATGEAVCIPDMITDEKVTFSAGTASIASLHTAEEFELTGGTLTTGGITTSSTAPVRITGGTLAGSGSLSGGTFLWSALAGLGSYEVATDATLELPDAATYMLSAGATLTNNGLITLDQGDLTGGAGATVVNGASGEVRKASGGLATDESLIDIPVDNDGLVNVEVGALRLTGGDPADETSAASDAGEFRVAEGHTLIWGGGTQRLGSAATLTGAGDFVLDGATLDVGTDGLAVPGEFTLTKGELTGSGPLSGGTFVWGSPVKLGTWEIAASATLQLHDAGPYELLAGAVLTNKGLITVDQADVTGGAGAAIDNRPAGEIRKISTEPADDTTLDDTTLADTTLIDVALDNDGLLHVLTGVVQLAGTDPNVAGSAYDDQGEFRVPAGSAMSWTGGVHRLSAPKLTGSGAFHLDGATLDLGNEGLTATGTFFANTGTVAGVGQLTGTFVWKPAVALGSWEITPGSTLRLHDAGAYALASGATLTNHGRITLGNGSLGGEAGTAIRNEVDGEIRKINGFADTAVISAELVSLGRVEVHQGTLAVTGPATTDSGSLFASGGTSLLAGDYVVASGGTLRLDGLTRLERNYADIALHGDGRILGDGNAPILEYLTLNTGVFQLFSGARVTAASLENTGTVKLFGDSQLSAAGYTQKSNVTHLDDRASRLVAPDVVVTGGTLSGIGDIVGTLANTSGTIAPGNSPGRLHVIGNFAQGPAGQLLMEIAANAATDKITVTGSANLQGVVKLDVESGFVPSWWHAFTLVDAATVTTTAVAYQGMPTAPAGMAYTMIVDAATGRLIFDVRDTVAPSAPVAWKVHIDSGHALNRWSNDHFPTLNIDPSADNAGGSGFHSYLIEWVNVATNRVVGTSTTWLPDGKYVARIRTRDNDGNLSAPLSYGQFLIDSVAPTPSHAVETKFAGFSMTTSGKTPKVKVSWPSAERPTWTAGGIANYRVGYVTRSVGSTQWSAMKWLGRVPGSASSQLVTVAAGSANCFVLEATDWSGHVRTTGRRCADIPLDNADLVKSRKWKAPTSRAYYRGSVAKTTATGVTIATRSTVKVRRLSLIATTCRKCGTVVVYLGKTKLATKKLTTTPGNKVVIPIKTFTGVRTGVVKIKVVSRRKPVMIDGFAISQN